MKIKPISKIFLTSLILISLASPVFAYTKPIKLKLFSKIQDPTTKEFSLVLEVDSTIANDRTDLIWQIPNGFEPTGEILQPINLTKGQNNFEISLIPLGIIEDKVVVQVKTYESNKNYLSTQKATLEINEQLDLVQQPKQYEEVKNLLIQQNALNNIGAISLILFILLSIFTNTYKKYKPQVNSPHSPRNSEILKKYAKYKSGK